MIETRIKTMQVEVWKEKITRTLRPISHQDDDEKEDEVSDPTYEGDSSQKDERRQDGADSPDQEDTSSEDMSPGR